MGIRHTNCITPYLNLLHANCAVSHCPRNTLSNALIDDLVAGIGLASVSIDSLSALARSSSLWTPLPVLYTAASILTDIWRKHYKISMPIALDAISLVSLIVRIPGYMSNEVKISLKSWLWSSSESLKGMWTSLLLMNGGSFLLNTILSLHYCEPGNGSHIHEVYRELCKFSGEGI